jgi:eukaryotic-like serine/threonine-protein kinase
VTFLRLSDYVHVKQVSVRITPMTPEEWSRIETLFHQVLELPESERRAFLDKACGGDVQLRHHLESLMERANTNEESFQRQFVHAASYALAAQPRLGSTLGHYKIISVLGNGGMGGVYQARDMRLDRIVALKVLLPESVTDPERRRRFVLEAKSASALNHPNIVTIYDIDSADGVDFIGMEYVDGSSLDRLISPRGLAIRDVLQYAAQIAAALAAAHGAGIVHRDIKPANIMVTTSGQIKVLDFGLAKLMEQSDSNRPTAIRTGVTKAGVVMGTAAYMAPEQAEGKAVDERADIFSFGAVLYEMITGKRAFNGDSAVAVVAAVLKESPDPIETVRNETPPGLARIVSRCLEKQRENRYASARLLQDDVSTLGVESRSPNVDQVRRSRRVIAVAVIGVLVGLAGLAIAVIVSSKNRSSPSVQKPSQPEMRLQINTPSTSAPFDFALSPDGRYIVFVASGDGPQRLWLRPLDAVDAQPLVGTEGARLPFWSADSRSVGFFASGKLFRIDVDRVASPQFVANAPAGNGGTWNAAGTILYAPTDGGALFRVAHSGGDPVAVTQLELDQTAQCCPQFLSDGRHFLFGAFAGRAAAGFYLGSLDGGKPKQLTDAQSYGRSAQSLGGDMVIFRLGPLVARRLDLARGELTGDPVLVADAAQGNVGGFSVSKAGLLAYRAAQTQLTWFDRAGTPMGVVGEPGALGYPELSPPRSRVAIDQQRKGHDGWLIDLDRGVGSPFTFGATKDTANYPFIWSPDGKWLFFGSNRVGIFDLYRKPTAGTGEEELLVQSRNTKTPQDWSSDGRFLLYYEFNPQTGRDLWVLDLSDKNRQVRPVVNTVFDERNGQFSPDVRWIAYETNESGRVEIVVQAFPEPTRKWQVSDGGGSQPRWRPDGKELYFIAPDKSMMAVAVTGFGSTFEAKTPVRLFPTHIADASLPFKAQYTVSHDGRFLINETVEKSTTPITLIHQLEASD